MLQDKSDFIKTSFLYILMLMLILFINPYLGTVLHTAVFMFMPGISSTAYSYLIIGICGAFTEMILLFFIFFGSFYNNKKSEFKSISLCFGSALIVQLIIATINYFYPYTAGMLVTYISDFLYIRLTGNQPIMPTDLPIYYYLITTLIADILRFGAIFLSFSLAKSKQKKETKEILGSNYKN